MKVLSIREPYATLIMEQKKKIETRSWRTNYRGELYIHACLTKSTLKDKSPEFMQKINLLKLHYGSIICKCNLVDCVYMTEEYVEDMKKNYPDEYLVGDYQVGRYAWILEHVEVLEKEISTKGKLSIWEFSDNNEREV